MFILYTDKGFFEEQAAEDNFALITINVDHASQDLLDMQLERAVNSAKKHPGQGFL